MHERGIVFIASGRFIYSDIRWFDVLITYCPLVRVPGEVPEKIGDLKKLKVLGLAGNKLTGKVREPPMLAGLVSC